MNEVDASQVLHRAISTQGNQSGVCYLNNPKFRYLTKEQAETCIRLTYSTFEEVPLVRDKLSEILMGVKAPITLVDLGCGDGRKAAQFIYRADQVGYPINRYLAIDVNSHMVETAVSTVASSSNLRREDCSFICAPFEELTADSFTQYRLENPGSLIYIFFGNLFHTFEEDGIVHLLEQMLRPHEKLLIGSQCKRTSDESEVQETIAKLEAWDYSYLQHIGRLLGLSDDNMHKIVTYNSVMHCMEVGFEIDHPSPSMVAMGIADVHRIVMLRVYMRTLKEICELFSPYFNVTPFPNRDATEAVLLCERLAVPRI